MSPLEKEDILKVLWENKPISIVRSGDGEGIVLNALVDLSTYRTCIDSVMKRQMGYEPTLTEVSEIQANLQAAYKGADIVGIPMHSNLHRLGKHWRDVAEIIEPYCTTDKRCSTDVFYELLYSGDLVRWIASHDTICYIGCRDIDEGLRKLGIKNVHSLLIAPEAKFTSGYIGDRHYPDQFNKVEWWMNNAPCQGVPCLVGAGVIGKIYTNWFRDRGGIGCDVGAVMDLFFGRSTRGAGKGLDVIDERFKL